MKEDWEREGRRGDTHPPSQGLLTFGTVGGENTTEEESDALLTATDVHQGVGDGPGPAQTASRSPSRTQRKEAEMVLAHAGGYELIVPLVMLLGLLFILRGGDPKRDGKPPVEIGHRRGRADT